METAFEIGDEQVFTTGEYETHILQPLRVKDWGVVAWLETTPEGDKELAKHVALLRAAPELLDAAQRALPWIGKLIAEGVHLKAVAPNDAIGAMHDLEAAIAKAKGGAT